MIPEDLSKSNLSSALDDARLVYFDGVLQETELLSALVVAQEVILTWSSLSHKLESRNLLSYCLLLIILLISS